MGVDSLSARDRAAQSVTQLAGQIKECRRIRPEGVADAVIHGGPCLTDPGQQGPPLVRQFQSVLPPRCGIDRTGYVSGGQQTIRHRAHAGRGDPERRGEISLGGAAHPAHRLKDTGLTRLDPERRQPSAQFRLDEVGAVKQAMEIMMVSLHANS